MRVLLLTGTIFFVLSLFLIASNFSVDTGTPETAMRSIDLSDLPNQNKVLVLQETEIGNQYINPLKKSIPNTQWEETHTALEVTISENNVQKDITFEFYSEMPEPSQKVLDRFAEKTKNPTPRKVPVMEDSGSLMLTPPNESMDVDDYLDKVKKNLKSNNQK